MERASSHQGKIRTGAIRIAVALVIAALIILGLYFRNDIVGVDSVPKIMAQKMELLSALRINLLKSVELEKSAVMADTDEASIAFAEESLKAAEAGDAKLAELARLMEKHSSGKERDLLDEFDACWAEFRRVDRQVLDFAVQNTNLKAARLSFGAGSGAMRQLEKELARLVRDTPEGPICRLVLDAQTAALRINVVHAPHIASPDDAEMDGIEKTIQENDAMVRRSLGEIRALLPSAKMGILLQAEVSYDAFMEITARVLHLSRQNTNIKSFELSLNRKSRITAQCDTIVKSLQEAVQNRAFKATR